MKDIKFKMTAYTDAGGRPGKPNEDNFFADDNLSDNICAYSREEKEISLVPKGALMVVSDGMGGMNAGDVASDLAIQTVKKYFVADMITDEVLKSQESILSYMRKVIVEADSTIKEKGKSDPDKKGMGATIVMAWFLQSKVYIGWCGDSRAYLFNPVTGLQQVSKDHSYVQELVDSGALDPDLAFDHPNNNIITRSLGDPSQKAKPDFVVVDLHKEDIILLCSDGLSGVLRDKTMETIMSQYSDNLISCREALFSAAKAADWTDNTTVTLCQITSGCPIQKRTDPAPIFVQTQPRHCSFKSVLLLIIAFVIGLAAGGFAMWKFAPDGTKPVADIVKGDSLYFKEDFEKAKICYESARKNAQLTAKDSVHCADRIELCNLNLKMVEPETSNNNTALTSPIVEKTQPVNIKENNNQGIRSNTTLQHPQGVGENSSSGEREKSSPTNPNGIPQLP